MACSKEMLYDPVLSNLFVQTCSKIVDKFGLLNDQNGYEIIHPKWHTDVSYKNKEKRKIK